MAFGSQDVTSTSERRTDVPEGLQPLINAQGTAGAGALTGLEALLGGGNDLAAGFDPLQTEGQDALVDVARGFDSNQFIDPALEGLTSTAQGDFLFGNPGFDAAVDAAVRRAQPAVNSVFGAAGQGGGSGLAQAAIGQSATDAFANLFGQERGRQQAAQFGLPQLGAQSFALSQAPGGLLSQIGGLRQGQAQREIDAPIAGLERLLQASGGPISLQALLGQTGTNTQETQSDPLGQIFGGGIGLLGLGSALAPPSEAAQKKGGFGGGVLGGLFG